jgi:CrcB protein
LLSKYSFIIFEPVMEFTDLTVLIISRTNNSYLVNNIFLIKIGKHQLQNYLIVFFGAGIGGVLRYWSSDFVYKFLSPTFPYGTLFVNILGSFIIGFVMYYLDANELISQNLRIFLTVGFCGGLTTFSTFSYETINFLRIRQYLMAGGNIILNLLLTLLVLFISYKLSKLLSGV